MTRHENIYGGINLNVFQVAAMRAAKDHLSREEVVSFVTDLEHNCEWLYFEFCKGTYTRLLEYRQLQKTNNNGKVRDIDSPTYITRVFQYVFLEMIEPIYYAADPEVGLNCKPGHGITAKDKRYSVLHRLKNIYYDRREFGYVLILDQRKCYEHITVKVFRRQMRRLVKDEAFIDFAVNVCFVNGHLPIGTPTSPLLHHIVMLPYDTWLKKMIPYSIRYADDNIIPCRTAEEAQTMKWRIKNVWWYELGIRAKRGMTKILPLSEAADFCGYIVHRNEGRTTGSHDKGYVSMRRSTYERAWKATNRNWGSYFGIMQHADVYGEMLRIEKKMDLKELTSKIRIDRKMDAPDIMPKELVDKGIVFTVYSYEIKRASNGKPNWIKCLIGYPEVTEEGELTGKEVARVFHGNYAGIYDYHLKLEEEFPHREFLPMTNCVLVNSCGYIYKNSTNQINFIEEYEECK